MHCTSVRSHSPLYDCALAPPPTHTHFSFWECTFCFSIFSCVCVWLLMVYITGFILCYVFFFFVWSESDTSATFNPWFVFIVWYTPLNVYPIQCSVHYRSTFIIKHLLHIINYKSFTVLHLLQVQLYDVYNISIVLNLSQNFYCITFITHHLIYYMFHKTSVTFIKKHLLHDIHLKTFIKDIYRVTYIAWILSSIALHISENIHFMT